MAARCVQAKTEPRTRTLTQTSLSFHPTYTAGVVGTRTPLQERVKFDGTRAVIIKANGNVGHMIEAIFGCSADRLLRGDIRRSNQSRRRLFDLGALNGQRQTPSGPVARSQVWAGGIIDAMPAVKLQVTLHPPLAIGSWIASEGDVAKSAPDSRDSPPIFRNMSAAMAHESMTGKVRRREHTTRSYVRRLAGRLLTLPRSTLAGKTSKPNLLASGASAERRPCLAHSA